MNTTLRGVMLDEQTLNLDDLDLSALLAPAGTTKQPIVWQRYANTATDQVIDRVAEAQVIVTNKVIISAEVFAAAPQLKLVLVAATGLNNVDLEAAKDSGVVVCHAHNYGSAAVAQHTFALLLALAGNLPAYQAAVESGQWCQSSQFCLMNYPVTQLSGKILGLAGFGAIGQAVAALAEAFGMQVMVAESFSDVSPAVSGIKRHAWFDVLKAADVLTLHCPLTTRTHHLIDAEALAQMKPTAFLINTARGPLIDSAALATALRARQIAGAGLDVLSVEPPPVDDPLLICPMPNLIITPHMAWVSAGARQTIVDQLAESLRAWLNNEPLPRRVA